MQMSLPGKITFRVQPVFWILVFLIAGLNSNFSVPGMIIWAVIIFISVFIHEMGHALTAVACGQRAHIDFMAFGGLTHRHGPHISLFQEFLIVLNGPLFGLALAGICYFLAGRAVGLRIYYFSYFSINNKKMSEMSEIDIAIKNDFSL